MARRARGGFDIIDVACRCAATNQPVPPNPPCAAGAPRPPADASGGQDKEALATAQTVD